MKNSEFSKGTYQQAVCAIILFDRTNSFNARESILSNLRIIKEKCQSEIVKIVVGTKSDLLEQRSTEQIQIIKQALCEEEKLDEVMELNTMNNKMV